jgi:seryl-tRNA synthetase
MLDTEFIRSHPDIVQAAVEAKGINVDVHRVVELDRELRATVLALSEKRAERRRISDAFREVSADVREKLREQSKALGEQISDLEENERRLSAELDPLLLLLPNPPHASVPFGRTAEENVPIRHWGDPRPANEVEFDHVEIMERLGMVDTVRGVKIAGSRGYVLTGWGAVLEMALLRYAVDHITARGFLPLRTPSMVRELALFSTGQFPKGRDQTYKIEDDESYLTGSADAPLTAFHSGEILDLETLPRLYSAISPCFRKEAGSAGRDVRGVFRVHEFQKVEQLVIARNDDEESLEWHARIERYGEEFVQSLELPYRIVNAVTGDLGPAHILMHDLECWVPSEGRYRENYSASFFGEWQARRANVRFRDRDGKVRFCHTLNNTVVASPRILIPFCEHHQEDGTLRIPPALHRYVGHSRITGPWPNGEPVDA